MSTVHVFYHDCDPDIKFLFHDKNSELCPAGYDLVPSMNEYYIASHNPSGSDLVFEKPHVDGPFAFLPFTLKRCIVVLQGNKNIRTNIFSTGFSKVLEANEHVMFDYNRDLHNIDYLKPEGDEKPDESDRIVLKLHFVKRQFMSEYFAKLNSYWNRFARHIFVASKTPQTTYEHTLAYVINGTTSVYAKAIENMKRFY